MKADKCLYECLITCSLRKSTSEIIDIFHFHELYVYVNRGRHLCERF